MAETGLSPEQLASRLGVGNMTLRRWKKVAGKKEVPKPYERSIIEGFYQLLIEGHLSPDSVPLQEAIASSPSLSFQAAIQGLGVAGDVLDIPANQEDKMAVVLCQIGSSDSRKKEVDESRPRLQTLKKMGQEWTQRISTLMQVVQSTKLTALDKFVAYGALFYLICPFDLIPDQIPVIGFIDDFGVISFAVAFYIKKFPEIFIT